jgi:hypothetical protein
MATLVIENEEERISVEVNEENVELCEELFRLVNATEAR